MKYKVGERVVIRKDLKTGVDYGGYAAVGDMIEWAGKEMEICAVYSSQYDMSTDGKEAWWTDEMIERRADVTKGELTEDMAVRYRDGYKGAVKNIHLGQFNDNLTHKSDSQCDIVEVYEMNSIWKREEKKKMTVAEIAKELGYEIEIIKG